MRAFENAIVVHSAIGGSTNATLHLPAVARELGIDLPPELFDEINHKIPPYWQHLPERGACYRSILVRGRDPDGTVDAQRFPSISM